MQVYKGFVCNVLFTFSEMGTSFRASNEQDPHDLYQELLTGMPSQSQGTSVNNQQPQKILCE